MIVKVKSFATAKIAKFSTYFNKKWLNWLNLFLLIIVFLSLLLLLFKSIFYSSKLDLAPVVNKESPLPKFAFAQSRAKCDLIDGPFLKLESSVPELQVPNLRQSLQFKGKSGRPDSRSENSKLHFSFQGHSEVIALDSGEKSYINFFKNGKQGSYNFSSYNMPTNLWFIPSLKENGQVEIAVHMLDDDGSEVLSPKSNLQFQLDHKELSTKSTPWQIGKYRIDGTLLTKLKARWYGPDLFLKQQGVKEFPQALDSHRVDFVVDDEPYFILVKVGDQLIWKDDKWQPITPEIDSSKYPLIVVKKIDDRLMSFEIWDVDGNSKMSLNLLKSSENWAPQLEKSILNAFKFVGARTKTQSLFEINKNRQVVKPNDWFLATAGGWKKLKTAEEIRDYVNRKKIGLLFIFEGVQEGSDKQAMVGTIYNSSRTDAKTVEIPMQNSKTKTNPKKKPTSTQSEDDEEEIIDKVLNSLKKSRENNSGQKLKNKIGVEGAAKKQITTKQTKPSSKKPVGRNK